MHKSVLGGFVAFAVAAGVHAGTSGPVRVWYYQAGGFWEDCATAPAGVSCGSQPNTNWSFIPMPVGLGRCKQVAVGGAHFAAIDIGDQVRMWGNNDYGQLNVPWYIEGASKVALGESHTLIISTDGYVAGWGNNDGGQVNAPFNLGISKEIAAGAGHSLAIRANGTVRAWGWNDWGQTSVPSDLGPCNEIAAGKNHSVALRTDGAVRAWGRSDYGQTNTNGWMGEHVAAGWMSTLASSGGYVSYCGSSYSYCGAYFYDSRGVGLRKLAETYTVHMGLTRDGRIVGRENCNDLSTARLPAGLDHAITIAGHMVNQDYWSTPASFIAIQDDDCDDNGFTDVDDIASGRGLDLNGNNRLDSCEIRDGVERDCNLDGRIDSYQIGQGEVADRNVNGIPDSCDITSGTEEDCDHNGVIDSVQQRQNVLFTVESQRVGPIGYTSPRSVELTAPPYTLGLVQLQVTAFGDFSSSSEYLKIYLNGRWIGEVLSWNSDWMAPKNDCSAPTRGWLGIPRDFFNETIKFGGSTSAIFEVVPSIAVNANQCPSSSWVQVSLSYEASVTEDCNANGLLDVCEVAQFPDSDSNRNGIIDACENYSLVFECAGDLDGSGSVDTADISILLMNFGLAMPGDPNDLDANGVIDTADVSMLLMDYGDCN